MSREVDVWRLDLASLSPARLASFALLLSADERERADRFVFERDRRAYTATRGALRELLGAFGVERASIAFAYGEQGKPRLTHGAHADLHFNVSHSGNAALLAFARGREVGVDVEVERELDVHVLAESVFSTAEQAALRALPAEEARRAFFRVWARKEAFIKATGLGVSYGLDRFSVPLGERVDEVVAGRWRVMSLVDVPPGYAAAVAVEVGGEVGGEVGVEVGGETVSVCERGLFA